MVQELVAKVAKIIIYPIKSLDGIACDRAAIISPGTLAFDRRWAILDEKGKYVNGKRNPKVHQLRCQFDLATETVTFSDQGETTSLSFHLTTEIDAINRWLSDYFQKPVFLQEKAEGGFPDDTDAYGPTIISTATLETVASWLPGLTLENARSRFRANIEINNVPPFWEDQLFSETGDPINFTIGSVKIQGINPCQRCVVPTRDPNTGEAYPKFQRTFTTQRQNTLPAWTHSNRFNHYYRLSVNTRILLSETGKGINIGDKVSRGLI